MSTHIRSAKIDDAGRLASVHRTCFEDAWSEDAFRRLLDSPGAIALVGCNTEPETESQAFILVQVAADQCEILSLGTTSPVRRKGLARALLIAAAKEAHRFGAHEMFLEVADDNHAALALYASAGFAVVGRRAKYYRRADKTVLDAMMLRATLPLDYKLARRPEAGIE